MEDATITTPPPRPVSAPIQPATKRGEAEYSREGEDAHRTPSQEGDARGITPSERQLAPADAPRPLNKMIKPTRGTWRSTLGEEQPQQSSEGQDRDPEQV